ncbi:Serine acetyltransferase [Agrobacterium sp. DSM 25558]|nr:Serine acetyltransferase [Agrobacterium sp. DSM 25558]
MKVSPISKIDDCQIPISERIWENLLDEARLMCVREPGLEQFLEIAILGAGSFRKALKTQIGVRFSGLTLPREQLDELVEETYECEPNLIQAAASDLAAYKSRNAAFSSYLAPFLYFRGYQALQAQRVSNYLWRSGRHGMAIHVYDRICQMSGTDIHPAVTFGTGIFIDHAIGLVIGETAVVEDNVSLLHNVTLGATGNDRGDRHPKVRRGAIIGAGATILGNIEVGNDARVGAGSVVLQTVLPHATVVGIPARTVSRLKVSNIAPRGGNADDFDWAI